MNFHRQNNSSAFSKRFIAITIALVFIFFIDWASGGVIRSYSRQTFFYFWKAEICTQNNLRSLIPLFRTKSGIIRENEKLSGELATLKYLAFENEILRNELSEFQAARIDAPEFLNLKVISRAGITLYGVLVIDTKGANIEEGAIVFGPGKIAIGKIKDISNGSASVELFSHNAPLHSVITGADGVSLDAELTPKGNGNFITEVPQDFAPLLNSPVFADESKGSPIGLIIKSQNEPSDANNTIHIRTPFSVLSLRVVSVEK